MASFASSATTGGARKHAWTNFLFLVDIFKTLSEKEVCWIGPSEYMLFSDKLLIHT